MEPRAPSPGVAKRNGSVREADVIPRPESLHTPMRFAREGPPLHELYLS
jgi:hypothetical protein